MGDSAKNKPRGNRSRQEKGGAVETGNAKNVGNGRICKKKIAGAHVKIQRDEKPLIPGKTET